VGNIGSVLGTSKEESFKCANHAAFDIIFACNVLSFIHDIREVFQSVRNNLKPIDGVFAFSAEFIEGEKDTDSNEKLVLQSCARYAHDRSYVESLASEFGFETKAMKTSDIRIHEGRVIKGVLAVMTLSPSP
jgi:predicted TPR repeat methyltransferase